MPENEKKAVAVDLFYTTPYEVTPDKIRAHIDGEVSDEDVYDIYCYVQEIEAGSDLVIQ